MDKPNTPKSPLLKDSRNGAPNSPYTHSLVLRLEQRPWVTSGAEQSAFSYWCPPQEMSRSTSSYCVPLVPAVPKDGTNHFPAIEPVSGVAGGKVSLGVLVSLLRGPSD